ncbi:C-type mannose receptor 2-like, partial [Silurus meridionalis]
VFFLLLGDMAVGQIREYVLAYKPLTWESAQKYCRENYVDLATITTNEENQRFMKASAGVSVLVGWIGLNRNALDSHIWHWSDGEAMSFSNWISSQPDNYRGNESCVILTLLGWNDVVCTFAFPFYCSWRFVLVNDKYILVSETKTWDSAQRYCRENYVDLATITTNEENQMLIKSAAASNILYFWIGLHKIALDSDIWEWSDGESANFFSWNPNQPDNYKGKEGVVIMSQKGWNDVPYTRIYPFFCSWRFVLIRQYIYINISKNWDSAQMYCRTNYVDLATITTDEENQTLMKTLTSKTHIWIGLNRAAPGLDIWQWSDGEQAHFFNWMSKQPDNYNENENCVIMKLNGWNDLACEYANPFYCF